MSGKIIAIVTLIFVILVAGIFYVLNTKKTSQSSSDQTSTLPPLTEIKYTSQGFEPAELRIKKGNIVNWLNESSENATVNSADHPTHKLHSFLNLGEFSPGSSVQVTFDTPGTFKYHNHLNPDQKGTVIVE